MNQRLPAPFPSRRGLTLVELLVVLTILALMATVAITSTGLIMSQGRYDATVRTLTNIEDAILGSPDLRQPDGTPLISGFVADMGRLPRTAAELEAPLAELWHGSMSGGYTFGMQPGPENYSDIQLPCGWRGPYLRLGLGVSDARDGWGQPFDLVTNDQNQVCEITWNNVPPYTNMLAVDTTVGFVTVSGTVSNNGVVPETATVVLLYPDPSQPTLWPARNEAESPGAFAFTNVPIGLRAIRAVIDEQPPITKYIYVPRNGLTLALNLVIAAEPQNSEQGTPE